jgi:hypothetical protein
VKNGGVGGVGNFFGGDDATPCSFARWFFVGAAARTTLGDIALSFRAARFAAAARFFAFSALSFFLASFLASIAFFFLVASDLAFLSWSPKLCSGAGSYVALGAFLARADALISS